MSDLPCINRHILVINSQKQTVAAILINLSVTSGNSQLNVQKQA